MQKFLISLLLAIGQLTAAAPALAKDDPYLWLEDVEGERAMAWVLAQNAQTVDRLEQVPQFKPIETRLKQIYDSQDKLPRITIRGDYLYNFWQDAAQPRGLWRRTTLAQYLQSDTHWETLLDLDQLSEQDDTPWVFQGANCLAPAYRLCMVWLSPGGGDAAVVREYDTVRKQWVENGFELPLAKSGVDWRDENALWVGTDFGDSSLTDSGYPRQLRLWRRGTSLEDAVQIMDVPADWVRIDGYSSYEPGRRYDWIAAIPAFFRGEYHLLVDNAYVKLDLPGDVEFQGFYRNYLLIALRSDWPVADYHYPAGSLLAIDVDRFLAGDRKFDMLFTPGRRVALRGVSASRQGVLVNVLDNVRGRLYRMSPAETGWQRTEIALPGPGSATISAAEDDSDAWFFSYTDFLSPTAQYLVEEDKPPRAVRRSPAWFDTRGMQTRQYEAVSRDGTRIPYFVVTPPQFKADGTAPTVLYGYGGFEIPVLPRYSGTIGAAWLERGGVWVVANIRGGGEFGPAWHNAALQENRHKVYEDFIAVAEDLIARNISSPRHLGIMGGSQGGLLVGAVTMMRPELFNAAVSQVPLLDMKRYNKLLAGASWMSEYGNPDIPAHWAYMQRWSPYHLVEPKADYPEMFIWTTTRDDRVHPGHARKMAARMLEQGHEVLYFERIEGGHGAGSTNAQRAHNAALEWAYLWLKLGVKPKG